MYLYAFLGDADIQIVLLVLDSMDRLDSNFLKLSRVPRRNLIIRVRVCAVRVRILKKMCHYCPTVHE